MQVSKQDVLKVDSNVKMVSGPLKIFYIIIVSYAGEDYGNVTRKKECAEIMI